MAKESKTNNRKKTFKLRDATARKGDDGMCLAGKVFGDKSTPNGTAIVTAPISGMFHGDGLYETEFAKYDVMFLKSDG